MARLPSMADTIEVDLCRRWLSADDPHTNRSGRERFLLRNAPSVSIHADHFEPLLRNSHGARGIGNASVKTSEWCALKKPLLHKYPP